MVRRIICSDCGKQKSKEYPTTEPYPGEYVKFVKGRARKDFYCDSCNAEIGRHQLCVAFSIWADYGGKPYYPWENEYIYQERGKKKHGN